MDTNNIAFITLTNNGYIDYTLNCLKSLENINSPVLPVCYCVGEQVYTTLKSKGYECVLLESDTGGQLTEFQSFAQGQWNTIMFTKLQIIHMILLKYKYVLYTDGDIVFENPQFINYLIDNIGNKDILIQNDTEQDNNNKILCAGFMFIKSNSQTLKLFNPKYIINKAKHPKWNDQAYINSIKHKLMFTKLPLNLFPNGQYYYKNFDKLNPMMVHFNWVIGHIKKAKMQEYGKWYLDESGETVVNELNQDLNKNEIE